MKRQRNKSHAAIRSELERMRTYAGLKVPEISKRTGIPYSTLREHFNQTDKLTIGDLLAWMEVCGCEEITIRR